MKNDDEQSSLILEVIGIIPVIWFALLVAPYLSSGLMGILDGVPEAMNHPFSIRLCGDSVKTVLIFLLSYGMGIGIYISTKKHYRRGEEHGSAKWGNVKKINRRYKEKRFTKNKLLTMHVQISYNMRKHLRNVLTVVIGGSGSGKIRFFAKPNLMQANTSFVVLDPKGENLRDTGYLLEEKGYNPLVYRMFCLQSHYRKPLEFSYDTLDNSKAAYERLLNRIAGIPQEGETNAAQFEDYRRRFIEKVGNDLNTSLGLTVLYDLLKDSDVNGATKRAIIADFDRVLSLNLLSGGTNTAEEHSDEFVRYVEGLIRERAEAKKNKNYARADEIRAELAEKGVTLKDSKEGTSWTKA